MWIELGYFLPKFRERTEGFHNSYQNYSYDKFFCN